MIRIKQAYTLAHTNVFRVFMWFIVLLLLLFSAFSIFYLASGYDKLVHWFYAMNGCFYRNTEWTQAFFTPAVKHAGNLFSLMALVLCISGLVHIFSRRRKYFAATGGPLRNGFQFRQLFWYIPVLLMVFCAWYWGQANVKPGADEIFSAVNCAELSPFQVLAYYMLPNNHIYFNFINGYLARFTGIDTVQTGRIISLLSFMGFACCAYHWCYRKIQSRLWAYVVVIPIAFQFSAWAFGFQARGYECQLLCGWIAYSSTFNYMQTANRSALSVNTLVTIIGFALVPTFLFYFLAQSVFVLLVLGSKKQIDFLYWKHQFFSLAAIFLLYLPALCFSGLNALAGNDYVKSPHVPLTTFFPHFMQVFMYFINFIFGFLIRENHPLMFILFIAPLALFFLKDNMRRQLGLFYVVLWLSWAVVCLYMERCPFSRNMILHYSLSMAIIVYTIYSLCDVLLLKIKSIAWKNILKSIAFGLPVCLFCYHLLAWGSFNAPYLLYFMNVNDMYKDYTTDVTLIPPHSTVACSPERYCFYYYCRQGPYIVSRCPAGTEDYYVTSWGETIPANILANYTRYKVGNEGDEIYKHK